VVCLKYGCTHFSGSRSKPDGSKVTQILPENFLIELRSKWYINVRKMVSVRRRKLKEVFEEKNMIYSVTAPE